MIASAIGFAQSRATLDQGSAQLAARAGGRAADPWDCGVACARTPPLGEQAGTPHHRRALSLHLLGLQPDARAHEGGTADPGDDRGYSGRAATTGNRGAARAAHGGCRDPPDRLGRAGTPSPRTLTPALAG